VEDANLYKPKEGDYSINMDFFLRDRGSGKNETY
jgi:hypothetical protein